MPQPETFETSQYLDNKQHDSLLKAKRTTDVGSDDQKIIDTSVSGIVYIGRAGRGVATSNTGWLLTKIVTTSPITTTHAIDAYDNKLTATYS